MSARPKTTVRITLIAIFALVVATLAVAADPVVHTVQKGETLYAIARRYDVSVDAVMKANAIADPGRLFVGMKLSIPAQPAATSAPVQAPAAVTVPSAGAPVAGASAAPPASVQYVVKKGDTLYSIAKAHGASVDAIVKSSGMATTTIKVGQKLVIPVSAASTSVAGSGSQAATPPGSGASAIATVPAAASAPKPAARPVSDSGQWPAVGQVAYLQGKLKGVSIAASPSSAIQAIRAGTVISAGPFRGFGQVAFVQATDGLWYVYGGADTLSVRTGDYLRKGSTIGKLSAEKDAAAIFFVFKGADTIDPASAPRD